MYAKDPSLKKALKYSFKAVKILVATILAIALGIVAYVTFNKKDILRQITTEIGAKMNGKVEIKNMELSFIRNFPHVSVLLTGVTITDSLFNTHHHPFLAGKEVFISINLWKLATKKPPINGVRLQGGEVYFYTDTAGYTNTYLARFKKNPSAAATPSRGADNQFKYVQLKDIRFVINNRIKDKFYDLGINQLKVDLESEELSTAIYAKTDIVIRSLAFNTVRGSFLKDMRLRGDFGLLYQKAAKRLSFDSIDIRLNRQPFNLSGQFDLTAVDPQFKLRIHTRQATYNFIKSALPEKLAGAISLVDIDQPLDASATIAGPLKGGEPKVDLFWKIDNTSLKSIFMDFEKASFTGTFTNEVKPGEPRKDPNSRIMIRDFTAEWRGLPVTSDTIDILNLEKPVLTCDLDAFFAMEKLNQVVGSEALDFKQGSSQVRLTYSGPLVRDANTNSYMNGLVTFKDGTIEYTPRKVEMKKVNGQLIFKNTGVFVENLQCVVLNSPITMEGQANNLLTLIHSKPNDIYINWKIKTPELNLGAYLYLLGSRQSGKKRSRKAGLESMAGKIDELLEQGKANVQVNANRLIYKKFQVTNAVADVTLLEDRYVINKVSMDHSGGHIGLKGALVNQQNLHKADLQAKLDNVNVSKVFADFDNFGQDGVTAQSLEGKLSADIVASMFINNEGAVIPSSIVSTIDFSLKDGALNNYEPVKKIQNFIFKKRDFDNIRFAELTNRLEIRDQEIRINKMEIQSTVLSMFVEGIYSSKGTTDLSIQVPLSNLKKRKEDYNPENMGVDKKAGSSIFLRGRPGSDGNIKFKLDLFNKFDKEKKASLQTTPLASPVDSSLSNSSL